MIKQSINKYTEPPKPIYTGGTTHNTGYTYLEKKNALEREMLKVASEKIKIGDQLRKKDDGRVLVLVEFVSLPDKIIMVNNDACCLLCRPIDKPHADTVPYSVSELTKLLVIGNANDRNQTQTVQ